MTSVEILTLSISALAVIVSVVSLIRIRKTEEEQKELRKITTELSELQIKVLEEDNKNKTKPKFNVTLTKIGKNYKFYISNTGEGSAYNVNIELMNCEDSPLVSSDVNEKFPHPEIKASSRIQLMASIHMSSPIKYQFKLTWESKTGEKSEEVFWPTL